MKEAQKALAIIEAKGIKVGDRIRIIELKDDPDTRYNGMEGEITIIDSMGQLHGTLGGLAVIVGVDRFTVLPKE